MYQICVSISQLGKLRLHEIDEDGKTELEQFEKEKLEDVDKEEEQYAITVLEEKKAQMKPNMAAIAEYKKKVCEVLICLVFCVSVRLLMLVSRVFVADKQTGKVHMKVVCFPNTSMANGNPLRRQKKRAKTSVLAPACKEFSMPFARIVGRGLPEEGGRAGSHHGAERCAEKEPRRPQETTVGRIHEGICLISSHVRKSIRGPAKGGSVFWSARPSNLDKTPRLPLLMTIHPPLQLLQQQDGSE